MLIYLPTPSIFGDAIFLILKQGPHQFNIFSESVQPFESGPMDSLRTLSHYLALYIQFLFVVLIWIECADLARDPGDIFASLFIILLSVPAHITSHITSRLTHTTGISFMVYPVVNVGFPSWLCLKIKNFMIPENLKGWIRCTPIYMGSLCMACLNDYCHRIMQPLSDPS